MTNLSLSKKLKLLTSNHFTFVFQKPRRSGFIYTTILSRVNMLSEPRIGIIIAKKNIKLAHDRNRIKRIIRETFRIHQHDLPAMDFIVIAKKKAIELDNYALIKVLEKLWNRYSR